MNKETEEILNAIKKQTVEYYNERDTSDFYDPNSETKYVHNHYTREFLYNNIHYYIIAGFQYINFYKNNTHYHGSKIEFRVQDNSNDCRGIVGPGPYIVGMNDHFYNFDSNDSEFKALLKADLHFGGFPNKTIDVIMENDISSGISIREIKPLIVCDRISYISGQYPMIDYIPIIITPSTENDVVTGISPYHHNSYQKLPPHKKIEIRAGNYIEKFYYETNEYVLRLAKWLDENTTGKILVHGDNYKWNVIFFEFKQDAMRFKLMWRDDYGL
jgi:hypothetical protein